MFEYLCEACGGSFQNEEGFLEHFISLHVQQTKPNGDLPVESLRKQMELSFPGLNYTIENHLNYGGDYLIKLWHEDTVIEQYFGKSDIFDNPKTENKLIESFQSSIDWKMRLLKNIRKQGEFSQLFCTAIEYGNVPCETSLRFGFQIKGEEHIQSNYFYPFDGMNEQQFISSFKQYFVTVLQGKANWYTEDGYTQDCMIDGVPLQGIFEKGKRVRLSRI